MDGINHISSGTVTTTKPPELPNGKSIHVFISYATRNPDQEIAHELYTRLTEMGYKCCLHEIDFKAGPIQNNIDKFMKRSLKTIALLSENFKNSFWCSVEMIEIVSLHIENKGFPPIVLKLDNCEVPEAFKQYTYLSLCSGGLETKMADILSSINDVDEICVEFPRVYLSTPFVPLPCINYNQNTCLKHSPCIWPHICARFILSNNSCDGNCGKNHIFNHECLEKLKKCGFPVDSGQTFLLRVYKEKCKEWLQEFPSKTISGPCYYYNDKGCFSADDTCPFPHICKEWFLGKCAKSTCLFSHDISNRQTDRLLQLFGINTNHPEDIILWQYREKCSDYLGLKSNGQSSNILSITREVLKVLLYFVLGVFSYLYA